MEISKTTSNNQGGKKGRPSAEGKKRQYIIPTDVHEWIMAHGGSRYITDTFRAIKVATFAAQEKASL